MSRAYRAIGYIADFRKLGFFSPIFSHAGQSSLFVQETSYVSGKIIGFKSVSAEPGDVIRQNFNAVAAAGDCQLYVFVGVNGAAIGSLSRLQSYVEKTNLNIKSSALDLEIAELYNRPESLRDAREVILQLNSGFNSNERSSSLWRSMLIQSVISALNDGVSDERGGSRIHENIHEIMMSVSSENDALVSDSIWSDISGLISFDKKSFRERVFRDLPEAKGIEGASIVPDRENVPEIYEEADQRITQIRRMGRQEERLSSIISDAFRHPELGIAVSKIYSDHATLAKYAINLVRDNVEAVENGNIDFFVWLIERIYKNCLSFNKGELLLNFAKSLGDIPPIAERIISFTYASYARDVRRLAERIEGILQQKSPQIFRSEGQQQEDLFSNS